MPARKKHILLVGAQGYIGSRVQQALRDDGHRVLGVDRIAAPASSSAETLTCSYQDIPDDVLRTADDILVLAGHSSVRLAKDDPDGALANNFTDMITLSRRLLGQRFIYASSSSVYSNCGARSAHEKTPCRMPVNPYDFSKLAFDAYVGSHAVEAIGLRFGTVNGYSRQMRQELMINSMVRSALRTRVIHLSNPHVFRPILAMNDLVAGLLALVNSSERKGFYNMASFNMRLTDIATTVAERLGASIKLEPDSPTFDFSIDCGLFEKTFGFRFKDDIDGIIDDLLANGYQSEPSELSIAS